MDMLNTWGQLEKMSLENKKRQGFSHSNATKRKISLALSGKNHPNWGKKRSKKTNMKPAAPIIKPSDSEN